MKDLKDMLSKKKEGKKPLDENYKSAKGGILKDLMKEMSSEMGGQMKGLKKVTVAAPDSESLSEGLEKAKEMLPGVEGEESEEAMEMCPECEMEHVPGEHKMDMESLKARIAELEAKLAEKGE